MLWKVCAYSYIWQQGSVYQIIALGLHHAMESVCVQLYMAARVSIPNYRTRITLCFEDEVQCCFFQGGQTIISRNRGGGGGA